MTLHWLLLSRVLPRYSSQCFRTYFFLWEFGSVSTSAHNREACRLLAVKFIFLSLPVPMQWFCLGVYSEISTFYVSISFAKLCFPSCRFQNLQTLLCWNRVRVTVVCSAEGGPDLRSCWNSSVFFLPSAFSVILFKFYLYIELGITCSFTGTFTLICTVDMALLNGLRNS